MRQYIRIVCLAGIMFQSNLPVRTQSVSFLTYKNPVIPGDHPDCTVSKIGNDYYTTGSSFNLEPQIYHSTDLVHWRVIAKPVSASWEGFGDTPGGGCWGGQMVYYHNKYWHFFSRANTMHFTTADNPEGPWSMPVRMSNPVQLPFTLGYDNSIFIDDDGKWYLVVKNGQPNNAIVELGTDGQPTGVVYNLNWLNPAPTYPYSWAEGPVMWKYNGYYYYSFARDLSGGQKVMRSRTLTAEKSSWAMIGDFFNENDPQKSTSLFSSPNHSSAVVGAADSSYWVIHPLYAKGEWRGQGRQGLLNQVFYDTMGKPTAVYPINLHFSAPRLPSSGIPWMVPKSDFFETESLNPEWQFYGYTPAHLYSLTERKGWLRLSPKSRRFNLLSKNDGEHNYSLITRVDFDPQSPQDEAGLAIMRGDEKMFVKLVSTVNMLGRKIVLFSFNDRYFQADNISGNVIWLKMVRVNHIIYGYYSQEGIRWIPIEGSFDIAAIDSYSDFSTFTGTRQGLYVQNRTAFFDLYIYRDAYTPILAECPANEYGTRPTALRDGIFTLDSIHNNDWALYAGVEFGSSNYAMACDSVEFTVSSVTGGTIEVWLDSIDTGERMAVCNIDPTSGWNDFRVFKAKTKRITGRRDVYLRFRGTGTGRLLMLKWMRFIPITNPRPLDAAVSNDGRSVELKVTQPLLSSDSLSGFILYANGYSKIIDSIRINKIRTDQIIIYLLEPVTITDTLTLSYTEGNVLSVDSLPLVDFFALPVDNRMAGAIPVIKSVVTNREGDSIEIVFSKPIRLSYEQCKQFKLKINNTDMQTPTDCHCNGDDSSIFVLAFNHRFYYEDTLSLSCSADNIMAVNGGTLEPFSGIPVVNVARGYPLQLMSATLQKENSSYSSLRLKFDKPLLPIVYQPTAFHLVISGAHASMRSITVGHDTVVLTFRPAAKIGDTVLLSYENGNLQSLYGGYLENFYNLQLAVPMIIKYDIRTPTVEIYPVPSEGYLNIRSSQLFDFIRICSVQGVEVFSTSISPAYSFNVSLLLPTGVYLLEVRGNMMVYKTKWIVKRN